MLKYIFISALLFFIVSCNSVDKNKSYRTITVSIDPQKYFAEKLLPANYKINVVVKSGYNPESYEPSTVQMSQLEDADLYLEVCEGGFDEIWIKKLKEIHPDLKVYSLSKGIDLIQNEHHSFSHNHIIDPHIWVSPSTARIMVENMKNCFLENYPDDSVFINNSYSKLNLELVSVDSTFKIKLDPFKNRKFMTYHPVYSYLARDYNLQQISLEQDGKEPSVAYLAKIINEAKNKNISVVFVQKEFDVKNAEALSKETNAKVVTVNPLNEEWFNETNNFLKHLIESFEITN